MARVPGLAVLTAASLLVTVALPAQLGEAATPEACVAKQPDGPVWVDATCVDPEFVKPVIDRESDVSTPVRVRQIEGHFEGTTTKFSIYLPPSDKWGGRFYQSVYPTQSEKAQPEVIGFGAAHGGYVVQATGALGYRHEAATAKFARQVAAEYYKVKAADIYGYIYGGSGGSLTTVGALENTTGVWQGGVPVVQAIPTSIPNSWSTAAFAGFVLGSKKIADVADAVAPGGSGDPYATLDATEAAALHEVTSLGLPLRVWEEYDYIAATSTLRLLSSIVMDSDPTYVTDFWTKDGYAGAEKSPLGDRFRAARSKGTGKVSVVRRDSSGKVVGIVLKGVPSTARTLGMNFTVTTAGGTTLGALTGTLVAGTGVLTPAADASATVLGAIKPGDTVTFDNSWFLALHLYHRHQVPQRAGFYPWDQFRGADGKPLYPQRAFEVGPGISSATCGGCTHTGQVNAKVIQVQNLLDSGAMPWNADWYRSQVKAALGGNFENQYRLYYNDHAEHDSGPVAQARQGKIIQYDGIVFQALTDLAAWVEKGIAPPQSTNYSVSDAQVVVPETAAQRHGIQPVVDVEADGRDRVDVPVGRVVGLTASAEVPPGTGKIIRAEWDFEGDGTYGPANFGQPSTTVRLRASHKFTKAGTYYPVLRVTSQREGNTGEKYTLVQNLGRVRVVVR